MVIYPITNPGRLEGVHRADRATAVLTAGRHPLGIPTQSQTPSSPDDGATDGSGRAGWAVDTSRSSVRRRRFSRDRDDDLAACVFGFDVLQSRRGVGQRVGPVDDGSEGAGVGQFGHGEQVVPAPGGGDHRDLLADE